MRIILLECKKALCSPILIALLIIFSAWNVFMIYDSTDLNENLTVVNTFANLYGTEFTNESLNSLEDSLLDEHLQMNNLTEKKSSETFNSASDFLNQLEFEEQQYYTEDELQSIQRLFLKEMYISDAKSMDEAYESINILSSGERTIATLGLSGNSSNTLREEYHALDKRFEELRLNGEHRQWFFSGHNYRMHSLLFGTVFRHIGIETLILVVLMTALITNFEFENRTQLVTYATKRGRNLIKDKLSAAILMTIFMTTVLISLTLGAYFIIFDYSSLWKTSISSGFNWEYIFPFISWWDWSLLTYLLASICLMYIIMLLFSLFVFNLSILTKNSYFSFIFFSLIFIFLFLAPSFIPSSSDAMIMAGYNLSTLLLNPHHWWLASASSIGLGGLIMFKNYEWLTITIWAILLIGFYIYVFNRFKKLDIS